MAEAIWWRLLMRAVGFFAIVGALLIGLGVPAEAREGAGGAFAGHFGAATAGGFAPGTSIPEHSVSGSLPDRGTHSVILDRSSGHVVARDRHDVERDRRDFARSGHPRRLL